MAQALTRRYPMLSLNSDGHPHPRENALVGVAALLGLVSFATSFFYNLHILTSWTGLFGFVTAMVGFYESVTTSERFVLVVSAVVAGVGLYLGVARGGLI
ncbi:hypothetical protein [Kitasatospora camelliae]|uniref:Uncharacterized protein n=1 Tax=Kitasatospora camelliae TaxID=3156397 RepID=A0AAU8JZW0_9ACTN